jgi:hypothetical protein
MHNHQMARPRAGRELEERSQRQPDLLAIRDNGPTAVAGLPARVGEDKIETTELLKHRARSACYRSRRSVVEKLGIEASRKLQVIGPGARAARDLFANVRSDEARHRQHIACRKT